MIPALIGHKGPLGDDRVPPGQRPCALPTDHGGGGAKQGRARLLENYIRARPQGIWPGAVGYRVSRVTLLSRRSPPKQWPQTWAMGGKMGPHPHINFHNEIFWGGLLRSLAFLLPGLGLRLRRALGANTPCSPGVPRENWQVIDCQL